MIYLPGPLSVFLIPRNLNGMSALEIVEHTSKVHRRAEGAIGTPALAQVTMCVGLLALCMGLQPFRRRERIFYGSACILCFVAMAFTASRGASIAFGSALLYNLAFNKRRTMLLAYLGLGTIVAFLASSILIDRIMIRVSTAPGDFSKFWEGWDVRSSIVHSFLSNFDPLFLISGMGMVATHRLGLGTTHNTYVGAFVYGGTPGILLLLLLIITAWRLGTRLLRNAPDPLSQALGTSMHTLVLAACIYGFVAENFQSVIPMQLLFAVMVLAEKRYIQVAWAASRMMNTQDQARRSFRGRWRLVTRGQE